MVLQKICFFAVIAFQAFLAFRLDAGREIEKNGISFRYYPKHYIAPKRWIRNLFHIKKHKIPRYLYYELLFSLFFLMLGLFNIVVCIVTDGEAFITGVLLMVHFCLTGVFIILFLIMGALYKRK